MKKRNVFLLGLLMVLLGMGFVLMGCGDDDDDSTGTGGGYSWSQWTTAATNPSTNSTFFQVESECPREVQIEIQNGSPTSVTLTTPWQIKSVTPTGSGSISYRYRTNGFGVKAGTMSSSTVMFHCHVSMAR
jgi:hypothetical protein